MWTKPLFVKFTSARTGEKDVYVDVTGITSIVDGSLESMPHIAPENYSVNSFTAIEGKSESLYVKEPADYVVDVINTALRDYNPHENILNGSLLDRYIYLIESMKNVLEGPMK